MAYSTSRDPAQLAQTISTNIQRITQGSAEIQRIVNQLGTVQDTAELQNQLQQKIQHVNKFAKDTDKGLKEFSSLPFDSDQRQRKLQKDRLLNEFTSALTNFQKIQRLAAEKEKDFVARVRAGSRVSVGGGDDGLRDGSLVNWENESQSQATLQEDLITEDDMRLIEEREIAIHQLEEDIRGVNEIFKDLGMMVHEQGEMIDSIEANVESADVHVHQANQQLARAAEYQRKSRKKICIIILVLVILIAILAVIIWVATKKCRHMKLGTNTSWRRQGRSRAGGWTTDCFACGNASSGPYKQAIENFRRWIVVLFQSAYWAL